MHADLVAISNLWHIDSANDRLRAEHEALTSAVRSADAGLKEAEAAATAAVAQQESVRQSTRKNDRELADYVERRDRTRAMIEGGSAPDYEAAERQLAQSLEIIDRLETVALDLMEATEAADRAIAETRRTVSLSQVALSTGREALAARDAAIRSELTVLIAERLPVASLLPIEFRAQYAQQRQRKKAALVNTEGNVCRTCQTIIPAQRVLETAIFRAVHACPGCGGWLLP